MTERELVHDPSYVEDRLFLEVAWGIAMEFLPTVDDPRADPRAVQKKFESPDSGLSDSQLRSGLQMAVNDMLSWARYWPATTVARLDDELGAKGIRGVFERWRSQDSWIRRILKRGKLNSEVEWYLVREIVATGPCDSISEDDCVRLEQLCEAYPPDEGDVAP